MYSRIAASDSFRLRPPLARLGQSQAADPHWIQVHIARYLRHSGFFLHMDRLEPPLKHVAGGSVRPIETHGVRQLQPLDRPAQVVGHGADQQVVMVVHQDKRVNLDLKSFAEVRQSPEERPPVLVGEKDPLPSMPPVDHVIPSPGSRDAQRSSHGTTLSGTP